MKTETLANVHRIKKPIEREVEVLEPKEWVKIYCKHFNKQMATASCLRKIPVIFAKTNEMVKSFQKEYPSNEILNQFFMAWISNSVRDDSLSF